jgi:hypothetical protein
MAVIEDRRIALLEAAHHHWGRDVAVTLMEMLPPSGWGDVATRQRVDALERNMELRFQLVDQRFDALETKVEGELALMAREMHAGFATVEARTIRWVVGTGIAIVGALSGLGALLLAIR